MKNYKTRIRKIQETDAPVTGVVSANSVNFEFIEEFSISEFEIEIENQRKEMEENLGKFLNSLPAFFQQDREKFKTILLETMEEAVSETIEYSSYNSNYCQFLGFTPVIDDNGKIILEIDENAEISAIYNPDANTIQIVRSYWVLPCTQCSPCYPGQGDLDTVRTWEEYQENSKYPYIYCCYALPVDCLYIKEEI